ncbi:unnamed protein product [Rotaria sordida]|uniref:Uncharacterized protein n=1 Tax=Rotaria sordida TaxID=392033 RepID=A0A815DMR5_9BILA|nr:unnamed protein product [Rotaria sordida]
MQNQTEIVDTTGILPSAPWQPPPQSSITSQWHELNLTHNSRNHRKTGRQHTVAAKQGKFSRYDANRNMVSRNTQSDYYGDEYYSTTLSV